MVKNTMVFEEGGAGSTEERKDKTLEPQCFSAIYSFRVTR